jgi:maltodextrin utilization protein YvdJ
MALMGSERAHPHAYEANPGALFFWLANLPLAVGLAALAVYLMRSASSSRGSGWLIAAGLFLMLGAGGMVPIFTSRNAVEGLCIWMTCLGLPSLIVLGLGLYARRARPEANRTSDR